MQEGLFPKELRIYRFMMARLPLHRFFKHQSLSIVHSWAIWSFWSTLKPKYWQYFSLFYSRGFWGLYNLDYKVTKLQSIEPLFWKAVLYIKPAEPSSIILVLILFLGKTTKEILLMQMTNCEKTKVQQVQFITQCEYEILKINAIDTSSVDGL